MLKQSIDCQISSGCNLHSKFFLDQFAKKKNQKTQNYLHVLPCDTLLAILHSIFMERQTYKVPIHLLQVLNIPVKFLAEIRARFKNAGYSIIHAASFHPLGHCMISSPKCCRGGHYHYQCLVTSKKCKKGGQHKACHMPAFQQKIYSRKQWS